MEKMRLSGWYVNASRRFLVDKCPKSVYKFVISLFGLGGEKKVWHSITRSSRSTCQQSGEPQGEKEAGG